MSKNIKADVIQFLRLSDRPDDLKIIMTRSHIFSSLKPHYLLEFADPKHREGKFLLAEYKNYLKAKLPKCKSLSDFFSKIDQGHPSKEGLVWKDRSSLVSFDQNRKILLSGPAKNPIDTAAVGGKMPGYSAIVVNQELEVFICPHKDGKFHHSSFTGGEAVFFAGLIKVEEGQVVVLNDYTGHYQGASENQKFVADLLSDYAKEKASQSECFGRLWILGRELKVRLPHESIVRAGFAHLLMTHGKEVAPIINTKARNQNQDSDLFDETLNTASFQVDCAAKALQSYRKKNPNKDFENLDTKDRGVLRYRQLERAIYYANKILNHEALSEERKAFMFQKYFKLVIREIVSGKSYSPFFHRRRKSGLDHLLTVKILRQRNSTTSPSFRTKEKLDALCLSILWKSRDRSGGWSIKSQGSSIKHKDQVILGVPKTASRLYKFIQDARKRGFSEEKIFRSVKQTLAKEAGWRKEKPDHRSIDTHQFYQQMLRDLGSISDPDAARSEAAGSSLVFGAQQRLEAAQEAVQTVAGARHASDDAYKDC